MKTRHIARWPWFISPALAFLFVLIAVSLCAEEAVKPDPGQALLQIWVGEWKYEGTAKDTPLGPGGTFAGTRTARMILNGMFLETKEHDTGKDNTGKMTTWDALIIQWYDPVTKTYLDRGFEWDGALGSGVTTVEGNTWTLTLTRTSRNGETTVTKQSQTFSSDHKTCVTKGELQLKDGTWIPLHEFTLKKVDK